MRQFRVLLFVLCALSVMVSCGKKKGANNVFLVNNDPNLGGPPSGQDGSACVSDRGCDGDVCLTSGQGWDSGYCTTLDCVESGCTGDDAQCIQFPDKSSYCLDACESNSDCRRDYRCRPLDSTGRKVCFRDEGDGPGAGEIGSNCAGNKDCRGDFVCDDGHPGGYCIRKNCSETCPEGSACVDWDGNLRCVQACEVTRDCRTGYICDGFDGENVCVASEAIDPPFSFDVTKDLLGIVCGGEEVGVENGGTRWTMNYDVPEGTTSYMLVPHVASGSLRPLSSTLPSGEVIDFVEGYVHHNIRVTEFQFFDQESQGIYGEIAMDWPILVPYAPKFADLVEPGTHTLELLTSTSEPCLYVIAASEPGTTIDLDVYFVGLDGFSAQTAPNNSDLREVFAAVDELLNEGGVVVGDIQYHDAPREIAERYSFVRNIAEMKRATAFGAPRDETLEGHLSVDVFLVEDLSINGTEILGLSNGLPGPVGIHGNPANGLIFTGVDIGSDNRFVGHIMAHELGHYLGLRHTTEIAHNPGDPDSDAFNALLGTTDPIEDTPVCDNVLVQGFGCPDATNLMFPAAPPVEIDTIVTPSQTDMLRANPTLKPASE